MNDTIARDQEDIIAYLEKYGILTESIAHCALADILPLSFERAIDDLVANQVVRMSYKPGRRPVYYLVQDEELSLKTLFN